MRYLAVCVVLVCTYPSYASTVSGTVEGLADIAIQQFVEGQQVGPTVNYSNVPSTLSFSITANGEFGDGPFEFSLTNSVFSLDSTKPDPLYGIAPQDPQYFTYITDGSATGSVRSAVYHLWSLEGWVIVTDPDLVTANYVYAPWDSLDTGQTYTVSFTTDPPAGLPEPSSVVMMAVGVLATLFRRLKCVH